MSHPATVTAAILDSVTDWTRPLLTFYDDETGERTELSAATLGNWAAKTANFLRGELGLTEGDTVVVDLPHHWQTAAILLGSWWAGAHVRLGHEVDDTAVAVFTCEARLDDHEDADEVLVASLDPFALPVRDLPFGVTDFSTAVRVHGDQFSPIRTSSDLPALDGRSTAEVLDAATARAAADGVTSGARVLSARGWATADAVIDGLLSVLAVGASLISVAQVDPDTLDRKAASEKSTLTLT